MERLIEEIKNHKILSIIMCVLFILTITLFIINRNNKNNLYKSATDDIIRIERIHVIYEKNDPVATNYLEIDLSTKEISNYIMYNINNNILDNNLYFSEDYEVPNKEYKYDMLGNYNLDDFEFKKINKIIRSMINNPDEYKNLGNYYDGTPQKIIVENSRMADNNDKNKKNFYTQYYYKVYSVDKKNNSKVLGYLYLEKDLIFIEYLYDLEFKK